jgi:hypothetical protein
LIRSALQRPATTAEGDIGSERNRSMTPRSMSVATTVIVLPIPNAMFIAKIPGIRKSR